MKMKAKTEMDASNQFNWKIGLYRGLSVIVLTSIIGLLTIKAQYANLHVVGMEESMSNPYYTQFAIDGSVIYGMTTSGGINGKGVIFKMNKDGTGFQIILDFDGATKGSSPKGSLILAGSILYGMTSEGGANDYGVIFKVNTDGTGYQKLLDFDGTSKGANPYGALLISGSKLYGTTYRGGANNYGVIFRINTDGTSFLKLLDFDGSSKGANPNGSLIISGSSLYGMTVNGGSYSKGAIFKIHTDGSGFSKLRNFNGTERGAHPYGSLSLSGTKLYGMTHSGGANNLGCIFSINTDGTGHTRLLDFDGVNRGANPKGSLFLSGTVLYGATTSGGTYDKGCVFSINTDGTDFWKKWDLGGGGYDNDGINPNGSVILIGNEIIGMTYKGGNRDAGTIFRIYDYSIRSSDGVYRKLRDCYPAYQGDYLTGDFTTDGTVLYGTAWDGGTNNKGSIFKVNKNGTGFQNIYHFNTDLNGYTPVSVILAGSTLYGMTHDGGTYNAGIIFKINTDGSGYQKMFDFTTTGTGNVPYGNFTLIGSTLYGTTSTGGSSKAGTVFKINTDGSGYQNLVDFDGTDRGSFPAGSLTLVGSTFYGTTLNGGINNSGVIFKVNIDGSGFQKLLDFDGAAKGANPRGGALTSIGTALYGMTEYGGSNNVGVLFKINTDGSGFQKLFDFDGTNKGARPAYTSLTYFNSTLYGTARLGGTHGCGVMFKINPDGSDFEKIIDFNGTTGGSQPSNSLLLINSTFYGATFHGGTNDLGTIYKYDMVNLQIEASGGTLTCAVPQINVNVTSNISGVTYVWSGPNSFSSTLQNPEVSTPGDYIVTVTSGSESQTDTAKVTQNVIAPDATAAGDTITCTKASVTLAANSTTAGVTYKWNGPEGFTSAVQNPNVSAVGTYNLTVTNPANGCMSTASATVASNTTVPGATASVSGVLTCSNTSVTLQGNSSTSGVTYEWTGPLTFASTEQSPVTNHPGQYTLTVTNPVNGCRSTAGVSVSQDTSTALGVAISVSGTINCLNTSVTLNGSSATSGVSYSWSGPGNFSSSLQTITVTTPGNYILHVAKPDNGCVISTNTQVILDTITPKDVVAEASGILSCTNSSVVLTGRSNVSGATYNWVGPGLSSTEANPTVTTPGAYYLTVTNPANGCYSATSVNVIKDLTPPQGITTSVSGTLTCANLNVTISAFSSTQGVVYSWTGPGSYSSNERTPHVNNPGAYLVTITNPYNNCSVTDSVKVQQNITLPEGVTASASGILTCDNTVSIKGTSVTTGVTYSWTGPNGYTSTLQNPMINTAGRYTLTVTNPANECSSTTFVDVSENKTPPADVTAEVSGALNCVDAFVILTGSSTTTGVSYFWTGPDNFMSTESETFTITEGAYKLVITDPTNGCKDSASITVTLDTVSPVSYIIPPSGSPVALTEDTLTAQEVGNVTYLWGFSSSNSNWSIVSGDDTKKLKYHAGDLGSDATFTLTVTSNQNGCSGSSSLTLTAVSSKSSYKVDDSLGIEKGLSVKAYPNPFSDKAFIEFTPKQSSRLVIELHTSTGALLRKLFDENVKALQSYQVIVPGSGMTPGVYILIIKTINPNEEYTYPLIMVE